MTGIKIHVTPAGVHVAFVHEAERFVEVSEFVLMDVITEMFEGAHAPATAADDDQHQPNRLCFSCSYGTRNLEVVR